MIQRYIDEMLEISTIKEGDNYVLGYYHNRVPVCGLYLKAKKGSILEKIENMAKGKFKLEKDSENYAQEVRAKFFELLLRYLKNNNEPKTEEEIDNMNAWLYRSCQNYMSDISKTMKSGASVCDRATGEYTVVQLLSLDSGDEVSQVLQGEMEDVLSTNSKESFSYFRVWFNENKDKILTKKQLAYLENEHTILPNHYSRMNKTISERIYRNYTNESIIKHRIEKIKNRIDILNNIIEKSKTDKQLVYKIINKMKTENWLLEVIYSLSFSTCSMMTEACKNKDYICSKDSVNEIKEELQSLHRYLLKTLEELEKKL